MANTQIVLPVWVEMRLMEKGWKLYVDQPIDLGALDPREAMTLLGDLHEIFEPVAATKAILEMSDLLHYEGQPACPSREVVVPFVRK